MQPVIEKASQRLYQGKLNPSRRIIQFLASKHPILDELEKLPELLRGGAQYYYVLHINSLLMTQIEEQSPGIKSRIPL